MNKALSVSASQQVATQVSNADSAHEIWEPLELLAEKSAGLAKWRSFAADGHVIPS
jgi:hypothetical protein